MHVDYQYANQYDVYCCSVDCDNCILNAAVSMTHIVHQVQRALRAIHQMALNRGSRSGWFSLSPVVIAHNRRQTEYSIRRLKLRSDMVERFTVINICIL